MSKKVLILCTGNSCRSIIAEALINKYINDVEAYSSGVKPSGKVNPNAKKVLEQNSCWEDRYCSKTLDTIINIDFDLVVTVCTNAQQTCPIFPKDTKVVHIGFEDPDGKEFESFIDTFSEIRDILLPKIQYELFDDETICFCKNISKNSIIKSVNSGSTTLQNIKNDTTACTGSSCKDKNPKGVCCSQNIKNIIKQYSLQDDITSCSCCAG